MENPYSLWLSGREELERRREAAELYRLCLMVQPDNTRLSSALLNALGAVLVRFGSRLEHWGTRSVPSSFTGHIDQEVLSKAYRSGA